MEAFETWEPIAFQNVIELICFRKGWYVIAGVVKFNMKSRANSPE